ncbi:Bardet-Biedl syndrome 7 protein homolog isoform X5 [Daktulosphaira vitifoliae]|uniref:Bardet-Biedl syndrome 7 protein homolog isoform X5 n=1 Tax=Daktulosphaira vitifoliae TaxID=58002 RepID=UPI0021AAA5A3|nr:Bardet-Biedl syndrome 7 protein homolog isoform X5 [Daktulosphaira vitifoliae]
MELYRADYTLLGMVSPNCMKIIPSSQNDEAENKTQKIIVGDQEGILQLFQIRKGKMNMLFKTLPLDKINNICLGGAFGTIQDKIFVSMGTSVKGYTKKGRMFLSFDTGLTEPVKCMYVSGNELFVSGRHVFNHFSDCKDCNTYLCPETINSLLVLDILKMQTVIPILACADLCIRVLEGSAVKEIFYLSSEPTCLCLMKNNGGAQGNEILVGFLNGGITLLKVEKNASVSVLWELKIHNTQGTVTCMDCFIIDGEYHLLVGRLSGSVEVYSLDSNSVPIEKYKYICSESITSVQGGFIRNYCIPEVIVTTFTGWLFGLTFVDQHIDKKIISESSNIITNDDKQKILDFRNEISDLERLVSIERDKYLEFTQKSARTSVLPYLAIKNTINLDSESLIYHLIIELEATIDNILLQCNCLVNFVDVENNNTAVVSKSKYNEEDNNKLLITYRCQLNTTKLELKMWAYEGENGILTAYITPLLQPKSCQVCKFPIKPLLYHQRTFKKIERGLINFKTDNITAIAILKDNFSKEATKRNIILNISYDISVNSLNNVLNIIVPKLKTDIENYKQLELIGAMKQLSVNQNTNSEILTEKYLKMIDNEEKLKEEVFKRPNRLKRLQVIIITLFDDWHKLKGFNIKPNSRTNLQKYLQTVNTLDLILEVFVL